MHRCSQSARMPTHLEGVAGEQRGERGGDGREALQRLSRHHVILEHLRTRRAAMVLPSHSSDKRKCSACVHALGD